GVLDLVSTTHNGGVWIHLGVKDKQGTIFQPAIRAVDETDRPIAGGNDVALLDWDGDGLPDLLVLDDSCVIRCHRGLKRGKPIFAAKAMKIHGQAFGRACEFFAPCLVDFEKKGRSDLVLGAAYDLRCGFAEWRARAYPNTLKEGPCAFGEGSFLQATD